MATEPVDFPHSAASMQSLAPAPLSGSRGQAIQRLQVGLFGLGSMVLLVGLASVVLANARQNEAQVVPEAAPTVVSQGEQTASDPLADAGIVPEMSAKPVPVVTPPPMPDANAQPQP